jgi:hypothetical protein
VVITDFAHFAEAGSLALAQALDGVDQQLLF